MSVKSSDLPTEACVPPFTPKVSSAVQEWRESCPIRVLRRVRGVGGTGKASRAAGVREKTWCRVEYGEHPPKLDTLRAMSRTLCVTMDELDRLLLEVGPM